MRSTAVLLAAVLTVASVPAALGGLAWARSDAAAVGGARDAAPGTPAAGPAHGANSFTRTQAARRLDRGGFRQVHDLIRDDNGVWHGAATRNGTPVQVWEDFKGHVGTE